MKRRKSALSMIWPKLQCLRVTTEAMRFYYENIKQVDL